MQNQSGKNALIVGYSEEDAEEIRARLAYALPQQQAAFGEIVSSPMPDLETGQQVTLSVRAAPVVTVWLDEAKSKRGDRDAYLRSKELAEAKGEAPPTRDEAYRHWASERLPGFTVDAFELRGFRLVQHSRDHKRGVYRRVPEAELLMTATVLDAEQARETVQRGIGDRKAYGLGFIRVMPSSAGRKIPNDLSHANVR
jgi:hypothetical protein